MAEAIELGEINNGVDAEEEEAADDDATEETNVNEDDDILEEDDDTEDATRLNTSAFVSGGYNPDATSSRLAEGRSGEVLEGYARGLSRDKDNFLKKFKINLKENGTQSSLLLNNFKLTNGVKGTVNGAEFNGAKIIVLKGKNFVYSETITNTKIINALSEFKELAKSVNKEYEETFQALVVKSRSDKVETKPTSTG